jgi:4-hydroxybenzoate polyprenyltransferase
MVKRSKYVRLLRPIAWITFLLPFSVGLGLGITSESNLFHIIFAFIAFSCWMSFSFIINSLSDKDVDKLHNGRSKDMNLANQPFVTGETSEKEALILMLLFLFSSLLFAWFVNPLFFILILIVDIVGLIYSISPTRFKARPVGDILCNTVAGGVIFIAGLSVGGSNMNYLLMIGAFVMTSIFYIPTMVTDYEFDKKAGLTTSAVYFSPKKILRLMYPLTILLIIIALVIFLNSNLELKILGTIMIIYTTISTFVANKNLKGEILTIHEYWILIPFTLISLAYIVYGLLKLYGFLIFK